MLAKPFIIDEILNPISNECPTGFDMRIDEQSNNLYNSIKDSRKLARDNENNRLNGLEHENTDKYWNDVIENGITALSEHSKDLEICSWLIEALVRAYGFKGLAFGIKIYSNLVVKYWPNLFPLDDSNNFPCTIAFAGLNGENRNGVLIPPILSIPVTDPNNEGYTSWHYIQAMNLETITDPNLKQQKIQDGALTLDKFNQAVLETTNDFYKDILFNLSEAQVELEILIENFSKHLGFDAPPSSNIKNTIVDIIDAVNVYAKDKVIEIELETNTSTQDNDNSDGICGNREKLLSELLTIASHFQKLEPHSPLPYILQRAVKWANMPLPLLLKEWLKDDNTLHSVYQLTGIVNPQNNQN